MSVKPRLIRIPEETAKRAVSALTHRHGKVMDDPATHGKDGLAEVLRAGANNDREAALVIAAALDAEVMRDSISAADLDRWEVIAHDTKKAFDYNKHTGEWHWRDRDVLVGDHHGPFPTRLEALLDAIEPYTMGDEEEE